MAEANAGDAVSSSQNSTDGAASREQNFFHLFDTYAAGKETLVICATQYSAVVDAILRNQRGEKVSNTKEHNWTKRFTMQLENGHNVLYRKDGKVVVRDDLFKLIQTAHHRTVHGGRDVTYRKLSSYSGISKEIISLYLSLCRECELKKAKVRKSVVVKPLLSEDFNSRCQVDLIDLQSRPVDSYSFLLVYQDHGRKEPFVELNGEDWVTDVDDRYIPSDDKETSSEDRSVWASDEEADLSEAAQLHHRAIRIVQQRKGARIGQKRQAESMLQSSAKRYAPVDVGTSVRVPVPDVDRSKIDHRNVMGVVVSVDDGGLYKIGTSTGVLDRSYARNQFDPCAQSFLMVDDVPQKEVALRTAAGADSLGGTQRLLLDLQRDKC